MAWFLNCVGDCLLVLRDINTTRETLNFYANLNAADTTPLVTNSKYIAIGEFVTARKAAEVLENSECKDNILTSAENISNATARGLVVLGQHLKYETIGKYATAAAEYNKLETIGPAVTDAKLITDLTKEGGRLYRIHKNKIKSLNDQVAKLTKELDAAKSES